MLGIELLAKAAAIAPSTLLRGLAETITEGDRIEYLPPVTVRLTAGHALSGGLLRVGSDRGEDVAVLAITNDQRRGIEELAYFRLRDVVAVTVHDPTRVRATLSAGALAPAVAGEAVSYPALRREFATTDAFPLDLTWDTLPRSAEAAANTQRFLRGLREALVRVQADELGRQAFARIAVVQVQHVNGVGCTVRRDGPMLVFRVDFDAALPLSFESWISEQVDALL